MTIFKVLGLLESYQLYNAYEIVIRLQGQLNIDAGLVNKNDDLTLRRQLTSSVPTIFAFWLPIINSRQIIGLQGKFVSRFLIKMV